MKRYSISVNDRYDYIVEFIDVNDLDTWRSFVHDAEVNREIYEERMEIERRDGEELLPSYEVWSAEQEWVYTGQYLRDLVRSLPVWKKGHLAHGSGEFEFELNGHKICGYFRVYRQKNAHDYEDDIVSFSFSKQYIGSVIDNLLTRREAEQLAGLSSVAFQYHLTNDHIRPVKEAGRGNGKVQLFWRADVEQLIKD